MGICQSSNLNKNASKSLCKIISQNQNKSGRGFFIRLMKRDQDFFGLITIGSFIAEVIKEEIKKINIIYDGGNVSKEISLNSSERFIKNLTDIKMDITIIEILPKDNIPESYFLSPNLNYKQENFNELINKDIIILPYTYPTYKINKINEKEFSFLAGNIANSPGEPILLKDDLSVIGIYKGKELNKNEDSGFLIEPIAYYFKFFPDNITLGGNLAIQKNYASSDPKANIINLNFYTTDNIIIDSIPARTDELFSVVVQRFYNKISYDKDKECSFVHDGYIMDQNLTMEANKCKSGDIKIVVIS